MAALGFIMAAAISCGKDDPAKQEPVLYEIAPGTQEEYAVKSVGEDITELAGNFGAELALPNVRNVVSEEDFEALSSIYESDLRFGTCVMKYRSTGLDGKDVWLSGRLYYSLDEKGEIRKPDHIVLSSRYTETNNAAVPSQQAIGLEALLVPQGGLIVVPDYLGYGFDISMDHPYCIPEITAENALDMVRAAKAWFSGKGMNIDGLDLYNMGYSQGGMSALAVTRYIQEHNLQEEFNLRNTFCGGGPYSMEAMQLDMVKTGYMALPVSYPLVMIGFKAAFPDIMTEPLEAYFSDEAVKAGIIAKVKAKDAPIWEMNAFIEDKLGVAPWHILGISTASIVSKSAGTEGSELYEQIISVARLCEMASGWKPETPVHFIHGEDDELVGYFNFEKARENLMNELTCFETCRGILIPRGHVLTAVVFFTKAFLGEYRNIHHGGESVLIIPESGNR